MTKGKTYESFINEQDNTIAINLGDLDISALNPNITISDYATISPSATSIQNFNNDIIYIVTAENGDTSTYTVIANEPKINAIYPNFSSGFKFFSGADIVIYGNYINPDDSNAEVYISDGINEYNLDIISYETSVGTTIQYSIEVTIPIGTPTFQFYTLNYRSDTTDVQFINSIDISNEVGPSNIVLNQDSYSLNDVLVITGVNLLSGLVVPHNGSQYLIQNSNNYDIQVNNESTVLTWTLNTFQFFNNIPDLRRIYPINIDRRAGKSFFMTFN